MASEISYRNTATGDTLYFTIRNTSRQMWNTSGTPAFEALTVANWGDYDVALTETPASSYFYVGTFPAISGNMVAGWYWVDVFDQAAASPAIGDTLLGSYFGYWDGTTFRFWADDIAAISGDVTAADKLEAMLDGTPSGAVSDVAASTTVFDTDLTEATDDHYNNAYVVFTSGNLAGQSRKISDYDGTGKTITVATAFTEAPADGDTFLIVGRSE